MEKAEKTDENIESIGGKRMGEKVKKEKELGQEEEDI